MKKLLITTIVSLLILCAHAQEKPSQKIIFKEIAKNETTTLVVNMSGQHENLIGELKDGLLAYEEKVLSVHYDQDNQELSIVYNHHMLVEDLVTVFKASSIPYHQNKIQAEYYNQNNNH